MNHSRSASSETQWGKCTSATSLAKNNNPSSMASSPIFKASSNGAMDERKDSLDKNKSRSLLQSLTNNMSNINLNSIPNLQSTTLPPTPAMHWKKIESYGKVLPRSLRGHTMCMINEKIYIFGGCDNKVCYNDLYIFDADTNWWMHSKASGTPPPPCRAHSCVAIDNEIYFFGGGDGPTYYNNLYVLDTTSLTWYKPKVEGDIPGARRAHTMWTYNNMIYIFAGGDGSKALNDVYALSISPPSSTLSNNTISTPTAINMAENSPRIVNNVVSSNGGGSVVGSVVDGRSPVIGSMNDRSSVYTTLSNSNLSKGISSQSIYKNNGYSTANTNTAPSILDYTYTWSQIQTTGKAPAPRGYHTSSLVGSKVIVFGGSDGHECFNDIHVLDLKTNHWSRIDADQPVARLSHSSTQVGSYLFIIGGHDGMKYSRDVLLLNLVTMNWETRKIYGTIPTGRGYHTAVLYDSRIYVFGGYDGHHVFNEMYALELSACAYLPQITDFEVAEMVD